MLWHLTQLHTPKDILHLDLSCSITFDMYELLHPDIDKSSINRDWIINVGHYIDRDKGYVKGYGFNTETRRYYDVLFREHHDVLRVLTYVEYDIPSLGSSRITQGSNNLTDQYLYGLVTDTFDTDNEARLLESVQYAVEDFVERANPSLKTPYQKHMYTAQDAYDFGSTAIDLMKFSDLRSSDLYDLHRNVNASFNVLPYMRDGVCTTSSLYKYLDINLSPITGIPNHQPTNLTNPYSRIPIEIPYGPMTYKQSVDAYLTPFVLSNIVKGMDTLINDIECIIYYKDGIEGPQVTLGRYVPYIVYMTEDQVVRYMTNLWFTNILGVDTLCFKVTPNEELIMTGIINGNIVFHAHMDLVYLKCQNLHITYPPF